ncbi:MAG: nucleotide kinase domain-containing protein [Bacteroidota bacterium]
MTYHFLRLTKPVKSSVYNTYWKFAVKRNNVFLNRLEDPNGPWTDDHILKKNRFTNVFRASDRVSQYLIDLQYQNPDNLEDVFFKTILFKIFNKIETYRYLERELGEINYSTFSVNRYDDLLTLRMAQKYRNYSAAYIMPSAGKRFGYRLKHSNHLALIELMMKDRLYETIANCHSLEDVYRALLSYPSIGSFLAFQYAIDINYSKVCRFSEMDFVVAGPGAKNGIIKCFTSLGDYSLEDIIRMMADNQTEECMQLNLPVPTLWGRQLQLIDCQNLFCEVDKYLRVTNPELSGASGRTRIKQKFKAAKEPIQYFFPPEWGLNQKIKRPCPTIANADIFS